MKSHRRLSVTFNLTVSCVVCVLLALGAALIIRGVASHAEKRLHEQASALAAVLGQSALDPLLYENRLELDALVENAKHARGLVYAYIVDARGVPLTSQLGSLNTADPLVESIVGSGGDMDLLALVRLIRERADVVEKVQPITIDGQQWGEVVLGLSRHESHQLVHKTTRNILLVTALLIGTLATVITVMFRKLVAKPLAEAVELAEAISAGDLSRQVPVRSANEVGDLSQALNRMTNQLQEAATQLREREEHIRLLLNSMAEAMYGVDTQGICTFCNPACAAFLGYQRESDLVGRNIHDLIHVPSALSGTSDEFECRVCSSIERNESCHVDNILLWRADESSFPAECWSEPIHREGVVVGHVVTFLDITERRRLEAQLIQSQKMEALGTFAGGVAHDFNNILMAIVGYGEMLMAKLHNQAHRVMATEILEAAERATKLTRDLLSFGRKQPLETRQVDLNDVVSHVGELLARLIGEDVTFVKRLTGTALTVNADPSQLELVLMNLATNARDAMPRGGRLTLVTERAVLDDHHVKTYGYGKPGEYALVSVTDTGIGMDEETASQALAPFFTTKEVGKGTGLGLSIVYGIVKQHEGYINIYSEIGQGTVIRIYLPLVPVKDEADATSEVEAIIRGGTETVLLAEDDASVRHFVKQLLEEHGYRVIETVDGPDAVRRFAEHRDEVDVLILDIIMPQMNGREVFEEIRRSKPDVKVLFASGYTADILSVQDIVAEDLHFIQKPIAGNELLGKLRIVLES